ncbi:MAG TPA: LexA family transcriptional regulator [Burkholderiales bacterium]|nr:LexA family transcriptional regulator [Burkholderiales bacterium]
MALGSRVKQRRTELGLSQAELSALLKHGISQVGISNLESRDSASSRFSAELAVALQVNRNWLEKGRGPKGVDANVEAGPAVQEGRVPLISWVRAGDWTPAADPYSPGDAGEWLDSPVRASRDIYALRVRGDSMYNPSGPKSYPDGCIIFIDPNRRSPHNGERIIAKIDGNDEVTFKVYTEDAGRVFLKPLNQQFPPIFEKFKVLGTVIYKGEPE